MIIRSPKPADWEKFAELAADENWRVPATERALFEGKWAGSVHVLDVDGFCGMVTAVAYEKSAWVGNLIVPLSQRGNGYGTYLFKSVLTNLVERGPTSVWLTASEQGRRIYERVGFTAIDTIERWFLPPQRGIPDQQETTHHSVESLIRADSLSWGESRCSLLSELCNTGKTFSVEGAVALLQNGQDYQVLGPWYSREASLAANQYLLQMIVASRDPSAELVIDCLASSQVQSLCKAAGFQYSGQSILMVCGNAKEVDLKSMMSLSSLGSIG